MKKDIFELARAVFPRDWRYDGLHEGVLVFITPNELPAVCIDTTQVEEETAWLHAIAQLQLLELEPMAMALLGDRFLGLEWKDSRYHLAFQHSNGIDIVYVQLTSYYKMLDFLQRYLQMRVQVATLTAEYGIETWEVLCRTK